RRLLLRVLDPAAVRARWSRDLEQNLELLRIGVLCFVQNDAVILRANLRNRLGISSELKRERDLLSKCDCATLRATVAVLALHLTRNSQRAAAPAFVSVAHC